jgi:hypothetical protein
VLQLLNVGRILGRKGLAEEPSTSDRRDASENSSSSVSGAPSLTKSKVRMGENRWPGESAFRIPLSRIH